MNLFYIISVIILLNRVNCNPVSSESTETETTSKSVEDSMTTELSKELSEEIETIITTEVIPSDVGSVDNKCSHCLNAKYLKHYFAKGCKPIFDDNCKECPKSFECTQNKEVVETNGDECVYNGTKYTVGQTVPVDNPCRVCQCGYGFTHTYNLAPFTTIHCITVECPEHFAVHPFPVSGLERDFDSLHNCHNVYVPNKCCAVRKKCFGAEEITEEQKPCEYDHKRYGIGEKIYPKEDKCKVCICDQNWNPNATINNSGCYDVKCNLETDRQLNEGCVPIYHEESCCPIEYYCPERSSTEDMAKCSEAVDSGPCIGQYERFYFEAKDGGCHPFKYSGCGGTQNNFRTLEECEEICSKLRPNQTESDEQSSGDIDSEDKNMFCKVNDIKYEIGDKLDIGHKCVDCECRIPPDFTCIQKSCPNPPTNECKITYNPLECCPTIDCNYNKTNLLFDPISCPTPLCEKGCLFETYPDRCPNCVCPKLQEVLRYDPRDV